MILTGIRLVLRWSSGPICEDVMSEGLEIKLAFPGGAEESVSVSFIQNGNGTASTAHTLVLAGDLGDVEQYRGVATSSVVTWYGGDLVAKTCRTYWGETDRGLSGHVIGILRVGGRFAACHSDAEFGSGAKQLRGKVKI